MNIFQKKKDNINLLSKKRINQLSIFIDSLNLESKYFQLINKNKIKSYSIINKALTHSSINNHNNYEKLEFKGDAVLRLVSSEFIERTYPEMNVGEMSELRSHLVSDNWLADVGDNIGIQTIILIGPKTLSDHSAKATIQADATEALIGALYEFFKQLDPIYQWLRPFWIAKSQKVLSDPHKQNYKSALQEWSQSKGLSLPKYQTIEKSHQHGYSKRFFCSVHLKETLIGEGWGGSRKEAEKEAAQNALKRIDSQSMQNLIKL